jgi:hypothetical protein
MCEKSIGFCVGLEWLRANQGHTKGNKWVGEGAGVLILARR